jgi:diaminopimelate decarboxylase
MSERDPLSRRGDALYLDEVPVAQLAREWGTPLYAYSRSSLIERASRFEKAFAQVPHLVAYSIKANMNLAVVRTFLDCGLGIDVTSGGELARALRVGADPHKIVYSGVGKRAEEIDRALAAGIRLFNVESEGELLLIDARAGAAGRIAPIAFRLNPDVDPRTHPKISTGLRSAKFGIPIELARVACARARELSHVRVVGVDCHIGSQLLELAPLREALARVKDAALELRAQGFELELIDAGGGLGVDYSGGDRAPTPEEYAETLIETVGGLGATIVCEPGRALTASSGILITRVLYQKENGEKRFVIVDGAMNDYLRPALYGAVPRLVADPLRGPSAGVADVVGPVCESTDRFAADAALPALRTGDLLVLRDVGAYGFAMASTYNGRPLAAEVMVQGERVEPVRRRQTLQETWAGERVPDWSEP